MAMDALKNIVTNVPGWQTKLEHLSGQIAQRQIELAALEATASPPKSIRNRGSTESLRPKDENAANTTPMDITDTPDLTSKESQPQPACQPLPPTQSSPTEQTSGPIPVTDLVTSAAIKQQTRQALAVAQARARQQVRIRHKSQSIVSVEGNPSAYRSKSMIIVYYDSYVQNFFEELVKFVSASRNLMRKAKMAAKVAHIKRMAEQEQPDDDDDDISKPSDALPSFRYLSTQRNGVPSFPRAGQRSMPGRGGADAYDHLDKGLEYVQTMSERAAHQFLRDGDCNEEIDNMKTRLLETMGLAQKEMDRIIREEPELAKMSGELNKLRTHRPMAMRKEISLLKDYHAKISRAALTSESQLPDAAKPIEIDMQVDELAPEAVEASVPPVPIFQSQAAPALVPDTGPVAVETHPITIEVDVEPALPPSTDCSKVNSVMVTLAPIDPGPMDSIPVDTALIQPETLTSEASTLPAQVDLPKA